MFKCEMVPAVAGGQARPKSPRRRAGLLYCCVLAVAVKNACMVAWLTFFVPRGRGVGDTQSDVGLARTLSLAEDARSQLDPLP